MQSSTVSVAFAPAIAEGRRSPDGRLSPCKKGPVVLALNSGADIVPFYFEGASAACPTGAGRRGRVAWAPAFCPASRSPR
jgi:1-acyl-sn-glycerol-3-phosphate acyltransferase